MERWYLCQCADIRFLPLAPSHFRPWVVTDFFLWGVFLRRKKDLHPLSRDATASSSPGVDTKDCFFSRESFGGVVFGLLFYYHFLPGFGFFLVLGSILVFRRSVGGGGATRGNGKFMLLWVVCVCVCVKVGLLLSVL